MAIKYPELFNPFYIGKCKIKNRIVMSPMHLGARYDEDGNINDEIIDYYEARAKGGVGVIYTGGFVPVTNFEKSPNANSPFKNPLKYLAKMTRLCEKVHAYGTKLFVEFGTGQGRVMFPSTMDPIMKGVPVAPSAVPNRWDPSIMCRPLTTEECANVVKGLVDAALYSKQAGADGVCVAGAYGGYFTDQFSTKFTNLRDDEYRYGTNKLLLDTIKAIKAACGDDFPVDCRIGVKHYIKSPMQGALPGEEFKEYGRDVEESIEIAKQLEKAGVDSILIGDGSYDSFYWLYPPNYMKEGLWLENAKKIKDAVNIPVICAGKINTPELANSAIKDGFVDAVALGRPVLADADWANKAKAGKDEDIRPCIGCENGCIGKVFSAGLVTCAVNPQCFYEKTDPVTPAMTKKKIAVIGGGVGGMEAARIAAIRGHQVDLYEKSDKLGGLFNVAAIPDFKYEDVRLLKWYPAQLKKAGVQVHLNCEIGFDDIEKLGADEVILATGANPRTFKFDGVSETVTASEVLNGEKATGEHVVVVGGGLVGCETALWLARQGKKVALVEMMPALMIGSTDTPMPIMLMMNDMLPDAGVQIFTGASFKCLDGNNAVIVDSNGEHEVECDSVIQAVGYTPNNALYNKLASESSLTVWNIGDSDTPSNVMNAVREGFFVGKNI